MLIDLAYVRPASVTTEEGIQQETIYEYIYSYEICMLGSDKYINTPSKIPKEWDFFLKFSRKTMSQYSCI